VTDPGALLASAVAFGLPGAPDLGLDDPLDDGGFGVLLAAATDQRALGLLDAATACGALPVTASQRDDLGRAHDQALGGDLLLERLLVRTAVALRDTGIELRVLKGAALAHTVYPDPALRSFGDIDLLVRAHDYDHAVSLLVDAGGAPRFAEPRPGFTRRFGKGVCVESPEGFEIDVHCSLVLGPFGLALDTDDLFTEPLHFELGGTSLPALPPVPRFLHACVHAAIGAPSPRLMPLRDVAQLLLTTDLDTAAVLDVARRWRCRVVVQRAVTAALGTLGIEHHGELADWARAYEPDAFERRALRAYVSSSRSYALQAFATMQALPNTVERVAYLRALALPRRDYVRAREGGYLRRLRRSMRVARQWRGLR
jgi:hypothetical protein